MIENFEHIPEHPTGNQSQICRVCLTTNVKMFSLQRYEFHKKYQEITGLQISPDDKYPSFLCWECAHHLSNCHRFKTRAVLSHYLLSGLLETDLNITEQSVRKINRNKNGLVSRLKSWKSPPNYFNLELTELQTNDRTHYETQTNNQVEITIFKNEDDEFLSEDDIKKESLNVKEESSGDDFDDDGSDSSLDDDMPLVSVKHSKLEQKNTSDNKPKVVKSKTTKTTKTKQKTQIKSNVSKQNSIGFLDASTFDISDLTLEEQISEIEKRKKTKNYTKSNFKCENCYKGFSNEASFKFHMIRHSNQSGEHECPVCKTHFKTYHAMRRHLGYHVQKYTCKHCDFATTRRHHAKNHEKFHKGTKYKCAQCPEEFTNTSTYLGHIRIKHPSDIVCELCGYSFVSLKGLDLHKKLKHRFDEDTRPEGDYSCEECGITFLKQEALDTHLNVSPKHTDEAAKHHVDIDGTKYKCPHCPEEFIFSHKATYRRHLRIKHPSDIVCELCGYSFFTYRGLDQHKIYKHSSEEPSQSEADCSCEQCELTFLNAKALETHLKVSPKHVTNFDYRAKKKRNRNENLVKRKNQNQIKNRKKPNPDRRKTKGPMQCEQCDALLPDGAAYNRHFRRAHPDKNRTIYPQYRNKTHMCEQCGRMFETLTILRDHMNVHGTERPFKCEYCAKSFKTNYYLTAHLRIHTGKKNVHSCNVCGKVFSSSNLKRHMLIHLGVKPFECEMCGKFFKHPAERKLHITHVHLKVPWPKKNRGARTAKQDQSQDSEASSTTDAAVVSM